MAGGGDLGFYIGSYTSDANATTFLTGRGYTQARGYIYWDSVNSQLKVWDGSAWGVVTGAGAISPWTESPAGMIYPIDYSTDDVAVGANAMAGTERFRVVGDSLFNGHVGLRGTPSNVKVLLAIDDLDDAGSTYAADLQLDFGGSGTKPWWAGCSAYVNHTGSGTITTSIGFLADVEVVTSGGDITDHYGFFNNLDLASGTSIAAATGLHLENPTGSGTITTSYGIDIEDQGLSSTTTYGIRIKDQSGTTTYGVYQEGTDDLNVFMGKVGFNQASPVAASYVEVLDNDETGLRVAYNSFLEKNATGAKGGYIGFRTTANVSDGSSSIYGFQSFTALSGGDSSSSTGFFSSVSVGSGDTITTSWGLHLEDTTGSGTITTAYGIDIEDQGLSSTTTYGIYVRDQSGTTTYGIYQEGTDDINVFMGQVGVNQSAPAAASYVEVLDSDETGSRISFNSKLEKDASSTKTSHIGFSSSSNISNGSASVTTLTGFYFGTLVDSGDTVTTQKGLHLDNTLGSGTVTTAYGIHIEDQGRSSTTTYGIYINDQSGTTTYSIYQIGTDDINVFMGTTGIGADPPSDNAQLYVSKNDTADLPSSTRVSVRVVFSYDPSATGYTLDEARAIDIGIINKSTDDTCDIMSAYGVYVNSPAASGGDIRSAVAFYCEDMVADADVLAGWGVYLEGSTTKNYMAGVLGAKNSSPNPAYAIDAGDDINISTTHGLLVNDIQVVGDQQSAISDLTVTGSDQDSSARQGVNDILAALRAHGLIAT